MNRETTAHCETIRRLIGKRSVVLVGLMGAGKSAIGRKLATMLEMPFVDADSEIETASKMTVADLFEQYGEPEFRALEKRVIARVLNGGPRVLATGGGAFMNEDTRQTIARRGVSIWLSADIDLLMERVSRRQSRPLLQNPDPRGVMQKLMTERYPVYAHADVEVPSQDVSKEEMAARVAGAVAAFLTTGEGSGAGDVRSAREASGA